ncbi:IS5 family transposase [Acidithiobacillus caldus]|uniref:IS5 family transposase n=1 Tax=Acidithiobacillus caldus TaxID=33059 RepID=UPI00129BA530|nr:IS5 family transposase [Acidithiobacillus caldus]MBU2728837.1 IS5 family transposase [Acidithiobacillus caldus]MBU2736469.1 IS5 family transposase [Acidithiobacillus caldus ATCC 51756]MBU2744803.1 IS5 family transposase [Acidithiobacillus caldus]MBU2764024.1 IS5 family transposase [Acidithiobacillus caldus]WMT48363.1 MAG: IS5 family transposase [Acidithiobacillus caldus]
MARRAAVNNDLLADEIHVQKANAIGDPLQKIEAVVDFSALAQAVEKIAPRPEQPKGGRPPYPTEVMVRVLVVKRLHGLSDEQTEFQLLDRRSFRRFCGLEHSRNIPDRTTIWSFENRIGVDGVTALFNDLDRQIRAHGLEARAGQIVDATLVPAPKQHFTKEEKTLLEQDAVPADWKPTKRRQKDVDASWTKKHGKSHHGYKFTVSVDRKHKFVRTWIADTAKVHDSQHLEAALDEWNTSAEIYADKGYVGAEREERLREQGYRPQIQRKAKPGKPLSACQERRNQRIAKVRARVEHVFAAITQWGGKKIRTIGQARATFAMGMMVIVYNMRRLAFLGA